jgi:hypothetical protein
VRGAQKCKRDSEVINLFTLLGTTGVKAVCRTLMKLSPGWESLVQSIDENACVTPLNQAL